MSQLTSLLSLGLNHIPIGDEGAQALAGLPALHCLWVQGCGLTAMGATSLVFSPQLQTLHLSENAVGTLGAQALSLSLSLRHLHLRRCRLGDVAVRWLAQNPNLVELNLQDNEIGTEGALCLAQSRTLQILDVIQNSRICPIGHQALCENEVFLTLRIEPRSSLGRDGVTTRRAQNQARQAQIRRPRGLGLDSPRSSRTGLCL